MTKNYSFREPEEPVEDEIPQETVVPEPELDELSDQISCFFDISETSNISFDERLKVKYNFLVKP